MVGTIGLLLGNAAAHAASITNRDDVDRKVTIIEGDTKEDHVLKPSQTLSGVCVKGCTIRLDDIEDGSLYYDKPDTPAAPAPPPARGAPPKG